MIAKEWLEDIKERFVKYQTDYNLNGEDVEWLIQQAERVQELETTVDFYQSALRDADRRVQELESELNKQIEIGYKFEGEVYDLAKENKRYREALEEVLKTGDYEDMQDYIDRIVTKACQALEGEE